MGDCDVSKQFFESVEGGRSIPSMEERKTVGEKPLDRRTRYTRRTLKEALLELMQEKRKLEDMKRRRVL